MGFHRINRVVAGIQQCHDCVGPKEAVAKCVNACHVCQQRKNRAIQLAFELQSILCQESTY